MGRYDVLLQNETPKLAKPATPNRKPVQKKLDVAGASKELGQATTQPSGLSGSADFPSRTPTADTKPKNPPAEDKRAMRHRHAFDIYQDQYEALLALGLEDRINGGSGSMSAMVRDALDEYLKKTEY